MIEKRDARIEKLGGENKRLKEQAGVKVHGSSPCPYGEDVKWLEGDLA